MSDVQPVHTADIDGTTVRFFQPPPGRHEAPWCAIYDLHTALGFSADDRPRVAEVFELLPECTDRATVITADGPAVIVSHTVAHAFIAGAVQGGTATLSKAASYGTALSDAIDHVLADLPSDRRAQLKQTWLSDTFDPASASAPDPDAQLPN